MKSTGIVRRIDELGRIVLPKEIRDTMEIAVRDPLEIWTEPGRIILTKYQPSCVFCGNSDEVTGYRGKLICAECLEKLKTLVP